MKSYNKTISKGLCGVAIALTGLGAVSCGDQLDLKPQGVLFEDQIGEEQIPDLMVAAYATLMNHFFGNNESFAGPINNWVIDLRSDDALKGGADVTMEAYMHQLEIGNVQSDNPIVSDKWLNNYFAINRCNTVLQRIAAAKDMDEATAALYTAEMKTLRAYYYFDMLRLFEKFPYIDETMVPSEVPAGNYTKVQVADALRADLKDAFVVLPAEQSLPGRFNMYAAAAILCKLDLFAATTIYNNSQDIWHEIEVYCNYIIGDGYYGLFDRFQDISKPEFNNGAESVLAVQFSSANEGAMYNFNNCLNCTYSAGNIYGNGDDFYLGSQDLINAYRTDADGLPYLDGYTANDMIGRLDGKKELLPLYTGNVDPRLDLTFGRIGMYWRANLGNPAQTYVYTTDWCRNFSLYGQFSGKKPYPAPYNPDVEVGIVPWGASSLNYMIVRFAEVLLMKAEALVEQNKDFTDAIALVNQVRMRANNSIDPAYAPVDLNPQIVDYKVGQYPLTGWNQENARKAVRYERRLELAMEGLRWFDLLRWGTAQDVVNDYYQYESQFQPYYNGANLSASSYYFPIPLNQMDIAGDLYK